MPYSGRQIVGRIQQRIKKKGDACSDWAVGIGKRPRRRLFKMHGVHKEGDSWMLMRAESGEVARRARAFLSRKRGLTRAPASRDAMADYVYAYRKASHTDP